MSVRRLFRGMVSGVVVISLMTGGSGCFGPFNLTKNVYYWNSGIKGSGEVNEKWMKEIVFFGMIVIPVYMFSALLDAFVFNAIQFWSGSNPIKVTNGPDGLPEEIRAGETTLQLSWATERRSATLTYRHKGQVIKTVAVAAAGTAYRLLDEQTGASYGLEPDARGISIVDQDCRLLERVPMGMLTSLVNAADSSAAGNPG